MKKYLNIAVLCAAVLPLMACGQFNSALPPTPKTPAQIVYELKAGLVATEGIGLAYETDVCGVTVPCEAPGAAAINQAIITADPLMLAAETAVRAGGSATGPIADAQAAIQALQQLVALYAKPDTPAATFTSGSVVQ